MDQHYAGDDTRVQVLLRGILQAFGGMTVGDYIARAAAFVDGTPHPTLGRPYRACGYRPMVELLRHLEANGFETFIASGGDRDVMRAIAHDIYAIPPERVIGSSNALGWHEDEDGGSLVYLAGRTSSTTGPSSRSGSGAAPVARSSPAATRTATSRCSAGRAATGPRCGC
jgi:hypothetical protein